MKVTKDVDFGLLTMKGPDKTVNEDYIEFTTSNLNRDDEVHILLVADGMGGHAFGDVASFYASNYILKWWRNKLLQHDHPDRFLEDCQDTIGGIFQVINQKLIEIGQRENYHLGTTLSVIIMVKDKYLVCHVGDTRIYRMRKKADIKLDDNDETIDLNQSKSFVQLTKDHSWARMQVENGSMTEIEAENDDKSHLLTQCIGVKGDINPYISMDTILEQDQFILCTDGLHSLFTQDEMYKHLREGLEQDTPLQNTAEYLIEFARNAPYQDDVSILIFAPKGRTDVP
ncbi:PP2C family protein-serine/threonine phosphatase [Virgibacillus oceani]|uniref:Serine/threonine protein phosphatase n=1 Tax=Virgibacillus oceani TaxID=1479511 RepID=A0A917LXW7_9BACI|nr:PP2C family serine/threonine-protein phosphatase [Virgibacillus oceani]GGG63031.1 serine/threonine protein phosphatase [Virgibacillus oceani]